MPVCPKCGEEIGHLMGYARVWQEYKMSIDREGDEWCEFTGLSTSTNDSDEFNCPECTRLLFTDIEEAKRFLKGELDE